MKTILLNGKKMTNKRIAHLYLKRKLSLPNHYGENLDALWDLLSTWSDELNILMYNTQYMEASLGDYGNSLINVFREATCENDRIIFRAIHIKRQN